MVHTKKIIKIGFASADWSRSMLDDSGHPVPGGANWVRIQQNRKHLKYRSVTGLLVHHPQKGFGIGDWNGQSHYDCEIIVLQRLMFNNLAEKMAENPNKNQIFINDVDDWYWELDKNNQAYELTHPNHNKTENIDFYKQIIQLGNAVTVSTPYIAEKIKNEFKCKNVHIVENCVTTLDFRQRYHRQRKMKVGWVGSTSHRSGDLEILNGILSNPLWKLHHSGHNSSASYFADKVGVDRSSVTLSPMHHPQNYARLSFEFDCGIAPLNDVPFNHAKSWIKPIEYSAANLPVVMSDLPEYRRLHEEYGIGFIAKTKDDWVNYLTEMTNQEARAKEAKRNRQLVEALNVKVMAEKWDNIFSSYL